MRKIILVIISILLISGCADSAKHQDTFKDYELMLLENDLYTINLRDGKKTQITFTPGIKKEGAFFTLDGNFVAYLQPRPWKDQYFRITRAGKSQEELSEKDFDILRNQRGWYE